MKKQITPGGGLIQKEMMIIFKNAVSSLPGNPGKPKEVSDLETNNFSQDQGIKDLS